MLAMLVRLHRVEPEDHLLASGLRAAPAARQVWLVWPAQTAPAAAVPLAQRAAPSTA